MIHLLGLDHHKSFSKPEHWGPQDKGAPNCERLGSGSQNSCKKSRPVGALQGLQKLFISDQHLQHKSVLMVLTFLLDEQIISARNIKDNQKGYKDNKNWSYSVNKKTLTIYIFVLQYKSNCIRKKEKHCKLIEFTDRMRQTQAAILPLNRMDRINSK